ncbi:MAG: RNA-binding protein [Ignavibacteriales bacterium]|nr:RNA-binding protein [Ignavibacteriales bacterium]MCF8316738.1 RNA-binding protein [Ignavibacteriales bacterium]MCF8436028.1 RNA-binding protein [Ignavibacteriales bacterium]
MNIYIGNLSRETTEGDLQEIFSEYGKIKSVKVIKDMFTGESKGFGFVEMFSQTEGQKAIDELNAAEFDGKKITVNEARPKTDKRTGGGGFGGGRNNHSGGSGGGSRHGRSGSGTGGGGGRRSW